MPACAPGGAPSDCEATLKAANFTNIVQVKEPGTQPAGTVIRTEPASGTPVPTETKVTIHVSSGPPVLPDCAGAEAPACEEKLMKAGFMKFTVVAEKSSVPKDLVTRTDPVAGTPATTETMVTIYISH